MASSAMDVGIAAMQVGAAAGKGKKGRRHVSSEAIKARAFNLEEAHKARVWTQWMSSTAHVREQADLRAAGLNPILSVMGGAGASAGTPSTAQGVLAQRPETGDVAGAVGAAGRRLQRAAMERDLIQEQTSTTSAQGVAASAAARKSGAEADIAESQGVTAKIIADFHQKYPWIVKMKDVVGSVPPILPMFFGRGRRGAGRAQPKPKAPKKRGMTEFQKRRMSGSSGNPNDPDYHGKGMRRRR